METMEEGQNSPEIPPKRRQSQAIVEKEEEDDRISTLPDCLLLKILSHLPSTKSAVRTGTLSKRWEHLWTLVDDRITTLPDYLLLEILSHLPSTKSAIRTGTLSKRWEHLWTLVPTLIFEHNDDKQSWSDFVSMIDKTLAQCRQSKLKKFEVRYTRYYYEHVSRPNYWIRYAVRRNVEELNITLPDGPYSQVDESLFTASCLTNLRLSGFNLYPTGAISWRNLKSLSITFGDLSEIENILSGSPVLETLELDACYDGRWLDIDSKSVKNLVFSFYINPDDEYDDHFDCKIEIYAPNISSLVFQGDLCLWKVLLTDVSSLVKAKLDYTNDKMPKEEEEEMLKGLILKLGHVKELKLGGSCSKVLSRLEGKGFVIPANLKFVDVESD